MLSVVSVHDLFRGSCKSGHAERGTKTQSSEKSWGSHRGMYTGNRPAWYHTA